MAATLQTEGKSVTDRPMGNSLNPQSQKIMSLTDACNYLGIAKATMYKYLAEKKISGFKYAGGRQWKFTQPELDNWISEQMKRGGQ